MPTEQSARCVTVHEGQHSRAPHAERWHPDLDGLRALTVLPVVLCHAGAICNQAVCAVERGGRRLHSDDNHLDVAGIIGSKAMLTAKHARSIMFGECAPSNRPQPRLRKF